MSGPEIIETSAGQRTGPVLDIDHLKVTFATDGGDGSAPLFSRTRAWTCAPAKSWPSWANPVPGRP